MIRLIGWMLFAATAGLFPAGAAHAQAGYPQKPIRLVIPYPAGGPVDVIGRQIAKAMSEDLGQPIVIDNRAGAGGTLGAAEVAKSPPDGYTLLFAQSDAFINVTVLYKNLAYAPLKDFTLISQVVSGSAVMMVRPEVTGKTLNEIIASAKAENRQLSYGSWGPGTYSHLVAETLARRSGANMLHVPYRGGAPSIQDFLGGHIQIAFAGLLPGKDFQKDGKARLVAVTGTKRSPILPDVPTFAELGMDDAMFKLPIWLGLAAPARTPDAIVARLHQSVKTALQSPEIVKFLVEFGQDATGTTPEEFRAAVERELPLVTDLIRAAGVEPQ